MLFRSLQVIAHIGLVGAYAVPFLLDNGSGKVASLFGYMAVINLGILAISIQRYWKPLYWASFVLTWLIFYLWFVPKYQPSEHFGMALTFISVFFATFYLVFLAYKLIKKKNFALDDIILLLANSAIFYGLGYAILHSDTTGSSFLGLFTLVNAIIHTAVALLIWLQKPADPGIFYYVTGLALVFVTIAIPVQWDGRWVTLLWSGEVAALFWIGRTRNARVYELLSYPLMFFVFFTLFYNWPDTYNTYDPQVPATRIFPVFNINFLTSLLFLISFGFILVINNQKKYLSPPVSYKMLVKAMNMAIPAIFLIVLYFSFIMEISTFWDQLYLDSIVTINNNLTFPQHYWNENIHEYSTISVLNYSLLFFSILSLINIHKLQNSLLGLINLVFNLVALGTFLTLGLYSLGELRESYIGVPAGIYYQGPLNIAIRYLSFLFVALIIYAVRKYIRSGFIKPGFKVEYDLLLHLTMLIICSNELINWMDLYQPGQSYKLGLTILFGLYALLLVALGIWKMKAHLRIASIVLFASTLLKLFFYDISFMNTISKTIVFVALGLLLLISSFLYTKYRKQIFEDHGEKENG